MNHNYFIYRIEPDRVIIANMFHFSEAKMFEVVPSNPSLNSVQNLQNNQSKSQLKVKPRITENNSLLEKVS